MIMILITKKSLEEYWCMDLNSWSAADLCYSSLLPCKRTDGMADGIQGKRRIADERVNLCAIEVERKHDVI